ncbi:sulfurtransferase [Phragmitibacter flavus]|uniref:Sulfurtransferase n=1 Tax=Phragmitibacter flavus TaxID=2576071 RepID=A0A5R8KE63_9BACT|nr:rhodanese-like domain-containing protein [Phragmitibacter flavus]TLD70571.1 sulfurtransferase [Phragmitibacter flavus]
MNRLIAPLALLCLVTSLAQAEIKSISPADAKALIENPDPSQRPHVIDTRGGYKDYFRAHLPNAHHLNFDTLRGTDHGVPVQYLPDDLTQILLTRAGVDKTRPHLLYADGAALPNDEILSATMVAYVLEKFGVNDILILDGGLSAWKAAGYATTQEYPDTKSGNLSTASPLPISLSVDEVLKLKDQPGHVLVDARPINEYLGKDDVWLRKGHIPGAISFHWAKLMAADNTHQFKPFDSVKAELTAAGLTPDKNILVYCGTSREGSLLRFYLKHVAGYPHVRLYEGSWKEYASLKQHPVETKANEPK